MRRRQANRRKDKKYFSKTAAHTNPKNYTTSSMRGGWRL